MPTIDERIKIREKQQVTIPKQIARLRNLEKGRELIVHIDDAHPNEIVMRIVPDSYAGTMTDVFAGIDTDELVRTERASWE